MRVTRNIVFERLCDEKSKYILATGKGTVGKSRPEGIGEYAAECRNMGYSIAVLELG